MFIVYVLKSEKDGNMYIGQTCDLGRRLEEHKNGLVKSTKGRRPLKLIYKENYSSRKEAVARERELKSGEWRELLKEYL